MKNFRFGVAGAGNIAHKFVESLSALPGVEFAGAASNTYGRAELFVISHKKDFPHAKSYMTYEEMAGDSSVDAVYIANLNTQHAESAMLFMRAGKPVLCEKPFALNAKQASSMISCAKENDVFLMEAMWTRFLPVTKKVMEWVRSGVIGDIASVSADFGMKLMTSVDRRTVSLELGGGALLDLGIYPISYASMLFGNAPTDIKTLVSKAVTGVDASFEAVLSYGELDGPYSKMMQSAHMAVAMDRTLSQTLHIVGTLGMIEVRDYWMAHSASLTIFSPSSGEYREPEEVFAPKWISNGYQYEAEEVMRRVRAGEKESPVMPLDETLSIMHILDGMRKEWGIIYPDEM